MPLSLAQLSKHLDCSFNGEADLSILNVASLASARSGDLSFLQQKKHLKDAMNSLCSVLIVPESFRPLEIDKAVIYASNPQLCFIKAIALINPHQVTEAASGIHASAQISESTQIGDNVSIGALAVIGDDVRIGANTIIGAGCIVENTAQIGESCQLHSRVTLSKRVEIGDRCILHSGVVIGSDGFGLVEDNQQWLKVPQIGKVIVGDDVEIGANTTIDRGALDDTVIENGCKLDNLIQVAHNVHIGAHTAIAACVGIAGSAKIGKHCRISGAAVILGHLNIVDHVTVTAMSLVTKDIKKPGVYSSGTPLLENSEWHKNNVRYKSLDRLARTVAKLVKNS